MLVSCAPVKKKKGKIERYLNIGLSKYKLKGLMAKTTPCIIGIVSQILH